MLRFLRPIRALHAIEFATLAYLGSVSCQAQASDSYLALAIRLRLSERIPQIVKIGEVSGKVIPRVVEGAELVYEVICDGKTVTIGALPDDPFIKRSFAVPGDNMEGNSPARSTTIYLNIPNANLQAAREGRIGLRFYRLKAGVQTNGLTFDKLRALAIEGKAYVQFDLPRKSFASQVRHLF